MDAGPLRMREWRTEADACDATGSAREMTTRDESDATGREARMAARTARTASDGARADGRDGRDGHGGRDGRLGAKAEAGPLVPATARGEATRRRILDAAEEVFGKFGYYEASISEITRRAGIAQGTFYIYFRSKHEVFAEVVEDIGKRLRAATRAAIAEAPDRLEAERRGFAAFFEFVTAHRRIYQIVQEAERIAPEAAYSYYHGISQGYERAL